MTDKMSDRELVDELARRNDELTALVEIGKALTSSLSLDEVLTLIMEKVKLLLTAKSWSLLLVDELTDELVFEIVVSEIASRLKGKRIPRSEGIAGWVALNGESLLIPDVSRDPRYTSHIDEMTLFATRSIVCVPIKIRDRVLGVIQLLNSEEEDHFSDKDLPLLTTIADFAAIAIDNARSFEQVNRMVITDDLTGLYNARHMHNLIEYEVERAFRYHNSVSLVFLDLDHFKLVNDTYGHLTGSRLLSAIGGVIRENIRKSDIAARYGGDEFVIVLPETDKTGALIMASNMRNFIKRYRLKLEDGNEVGVTASLGIASYPEDASTKDELVTMADQAMYEVKAASRDGVKAI